MRLAIAWILAAFGLVHLAGGATRADYSLLVTSANTDSVLRYDGTSGAFLGTFAKGGGLTYPYDVAFGPDHNLYVTNIATNSVLRFDGTTGAPLPAAGQTGATFVPTASGGIDRPTYLLFQPTGDLLVSNYGVGEGNSTVAQFDGTTGAFVKDFVAKESGGLQDPHAMLFLPNGDLIVSSKDTHNVLRYDSSGNFLGQFVTAGSGGLVTPVGMTLGPDGNLYVVDNLPSGPLSDRVLRYNGSTGEYVDTFVAPGSGGLDNAIYLTFTDVAVPEPGSLILTSLGLLGFAGYRWRTRRANRA